MSRTVSILRIFVASPSDVEEERAALEAVIAELNKTLPHGYRIMLELVRSETDTYPGIGVDAQDVISPQIADDYDFFIVIMWMRFGTPTARARSGTEEEFNRAYSRYERGEQDIHIMLYFKDAPIQPSSRF